MPLDPLSVFAFAASAVQFVDFAMEIASKGKRLYRALDGALPENADVGTVTARLKEMMQRLANSKDSTSKADLNQEEVQFCDICGGCIGVSEKLLLFLGKLKVPNNKKHRKWKSFRQKLKRIWSKHELDDMARTLAMLRGELDTQILVSLR